MVHVPLEWGQHFTQCSVPMPTLTFSTVPHIWMHINRTQTLLVSYINIQLLHMKPKEENKFGYLE